MFIIADIEWTTENYFIQMPTQLAAVKVDEKWKIISKFSSLIKPLENSGKNWDHVAFTGAAPRDFLNAKSAYNVFLDFQRWLCEDDVILWWHSDSEKLFKMLTENILKIEEKHKSMSINRYVRSFIFGDPNCFGDTYYFASEKGIAANNNLKHCSENDVHVLQMLMAEIKFPAEFFSMPLNEENKDFLNAHLPFQYDEKTNIIHLKGCEKISSEQTKGFSSLITAVKRKYEPCECIKKQFMAALKEKNADIIKRSNYNFIYSSSSDVFHKRCCPYMFYAREILGTVKYKTAEATGRRPCRHCCPEPEASRKIKKARKELKQNNNERILSKDEAKAILRHKVAAEEREKLLKKENLSITEKNDILTLTDPAYAFWAGQGYQNFHLHSCPRLKETKNLKGFSTYQDAIHAGYTPCKKCKPTSKQDAKLSIPITSIKRENEDVDEIKLLCDNEGYENYLDGEYLFLQTCVGKWKIYLNSLPVRLKHINLVQTPDSNEYHDQPRIFLSLKDSFYYIKKHDKDLKKRKDEGNIVLKFIY